MRKYVLLFCLCSIIFCACQDEEFTPKPRGYYRINFPQHSYQSFADKHYPFSFQYPQYGAVVRDTSFFGDAPENPYWCNIEFSNLGGKIYLTYKQIDSKNTLQKLLEDNYKLSYAHSKKADFIEDAPFQNNNHASGLLSHVGGSAASSYQFFATDSTQHFLRGALYFDAVPNADSLKPVTDFLKQDLLHLLNTLSWRK